MLNPEVSKSFNAWLDRILADCPTDQIGAYCFLLYEHEDSFAVQLVASIRYVESDPFAVREQVFSSGEDLVELPRSVVGSEWPQGLEAARTLTRTYLQRGRERARFGQSVVAVGFVDGDIEIVRGAA
jgi:hypothetical protein